VKSVNVNNLRNGSKVLINKKPMTVLENHFNKPGKGHAFNKLKLKCIRSGSILEKTFKSGESLTEANIREIQANFSYEDQNHYIFISKEDFVHYEINKKILRKNETQWISNAEEFTIILFNQELFSIVPPKFVTLKVLETDNNDSKKDTISSNKMAILENQLNVRVPSFIKNNEFIKVDTRDNKYVCRMKEL